MFKSKTTVHQQQIVDGNKRENYLKQKLSTINKNELDSISFVKQDGRKIVQSVNPRFLIGENGKPKNNNELAKDINAISHDLQAKYIIL